MFAMYIYWCRSPHVNYGSKGTAGNEIIGLFIRLNIQKVFGMNRKKIVCSSVVISNKTVV